MHCAVLLLEGHLARGHLQGNMPEVLVICLHADCVVMPYRQHNIMIQTYHSPLHMAALALQHSQGNKLLGQAPGPPTGLLPPLCCTRTRSHAATVSKQSAGAYNNRARDRADKTVTKCKAFLRDSHFCFWLSAHTCLGSMGRRCLASCSRGGA